MTAKPNSAFEAPAYRLHRMMLREPGRLTEEQQVDLHALFAEGEEKQREIDRLRARIEELCLIGPANGPTDWQILAVALLLRLGSKVELRRDEISEARAVLDPAENQTVMLSYDQSQLASWPPPLTIELRTRPRTTLEAPTGIADWLRAWIPEETSILGSWAYDPIRRDDEPGAH